MIHANAPAKRPRRGLRSIVLSGLVGLAGLCMPAKAEAVNRDNVAFSVSHSSTSIGGKGYESGMSVELSGNALSHVSDWLVLNPKFCGNYTSYGLEKKDASEELRYADLSLDGLVRVGSSGFYMSAGGEYLLDDELMTFRDTRGYVKRHSVGPALGLGVKREHIDISFRISELFGDKSSSYDNMRMLRAEHLALAVEPRFTVANVGAFVNFHFDAFHSMIADIPADRHDMLMKFALQPGVNVNAHIALFANASYSYRFLSDYCSTLELGGGAIVRW